MAIAITAIGVLALGTGIIIVQIAIITLLTGQSVDVNIPTNDSRAIAIAAGTLSTIITLFYTDILEGVPTDIVEASTGAGVRVVQISIIALLGRDGSRVNEQITTDDSSAVRIAGS